MRKIEWKYNKKQKAWIVPSFIHPTISVTKKEHGWELFYHGNLNANETTAFRCPFSKDTSAKKVAELIYNG